MGGFLSRLEGIAMQKVNFDAVINGARAVVGLFGIVLITVAVVRAAGFPVDILKMSIHDASILSAACIWASTSK